MQEISFGMKSVEAKRVEQCSNEAELFWEPGQPS